MFMVSFIARSFGWRLPTTNLGESCETIFLQTYLCGMDEVCVNIMRSIALEIQDISRSLSILITSYLKIAGRKRPALPDPSHKVRQGGRWCTPTSRLVARDLKKINSLLQEKGTVNVFIPFTNRVSQQGSFNSVIIFNVVRKTIIPLNNLVEIMRSKKAKSFETFLAYSRRLCNIFF